MPRPHVYRYKLSAVVYFMHILHRMHTISEIIKINDLAIKTGQWLIYDQSVFTAFLNFHNDNTCMGKILFLNRINKGQHIRARTTDKGITQFKVGCGM